MARQSILLVALSLVVTHAVSSTNDDHSSHSFAFPVPPPMAVCSTQEPDAPCDQPDSNQLVSRKMDPVKEQLVSKKRIFKRQAGRANLGGCGNEQLSMIMQHVVGPLQSQNRMRLGDIAKILQQSVQRVTGKSFEIMMGKGDMQIASHLMSESGSCRLRIGDYYTSVHETPVQYNINNVQQEQELSNIDFGERLGSSGYPGQQPWPIRAYTPLDKLLEGLPLPDLLLGGIAPGECFSGDLIVETTEGPKFMRELRMGDQVLSVEEGLGMVTFSPIVMFLHRDEEWLTEFTVITTTNGDTVKLTSEHLIYVFDCGRKGTLRLVRARDVTIDHCLMSVRSVVRTLAFDHVANVTKVYDRGIYSPLTATGDIIVNGVLSSCHSNIAFKTLQQSLFNMYRSVSFLLPKEGAIPFGLMYLASAIDFFVPVKAVLG